MKPSNLRHYKGAIISHEPPFIHLHMPIDPKIYPDRIRAIEGVQALASYERYEIVIKFGKAFDPFEVGQRVVDSIITSQ